jgi:hypothetical protein
MSEKKFYVYEHWRPDKNVCFYVGMGCGRRAQQLYDTGRNRHHIRIRNKLERLGMRIDIRIINSGLTRQEAFTREIERIAYWKAIGIKLCNLNAGGEGSHDISMETRELMRQRKLGKKASEETKAKMSVSVKAALLSPEINKKLRAALKEACNTPEGKARASKHFKELVRTPEHCAKISSAMTGKKLSPEHAEKARLASLGRKQSHEEIERRRAANTGKKRSPAFCQQMKELQAKRTPEQRAAHSERTRQMNLNRSPEEKEANRLRLIARNKSRTGKKCGPYKKKSPMVISETVH